VAVFGLVLARVGGMVVAAPVLGARQIPPQAKIGLAVMISLVFTPLQASRIEPVTVSLVAYALLAARELLIGVAVGLVVALIFQGVQMGSHLVGIQMGIGLGGLINPMSGSDSGILDTFYMVMATVIFLAANGHHAMIGALAQTYDVAPLGQSGFPSVNPMQVLAMVQSIFVVALRIALPAVGALLLADVALGLIGRAAPRLEVLTIGLPVKIGLGLLVLAVSTPTSAMLMYAVFRGLGRSIPALLGG
jgi:flagellar biosynthesis protein FliR